MNTRLLIAAACAAFAAAPAFAQIQVPGPISPAGGQSVKPRTRQTVEPAPVGIPGSRADTSMTGPAARSSVDMPPNEALFDSINRGDITGAKEAIGRGADLQGRNVLGLTPLELAVDLGRNDISFLLLSLRGGAGYRVAGPGRPPTPAQSAAERRAEKIAEQRARRQAASSERAQADISAPAAPRSAPLFAGNGGSPVPQAGFLGFDAAR